MGIQSKASRPFEAMSADLCTYEGKDYLICVDRYSGWPLVERLNKLDTTYVTKIMEEWFIDVGKPLRIRSDGGPQFRQQWNALSCETSLGLLTFHGRMLNM